MEGIKSKEEYGDHYHSHIMEMYKLHTEMADRVSHRRGVMNNLYTTGNIALVALLASLYGTSGNTNLILLSTLSVLGILICIIWYKHILSYKQLNAAKFEALDQLEKELPLPFYKLEYEAYKKKTRKDFSDIEQLIPVLMGSAYLLSLLFVIYSFCCSMCG